MEEGARAPPPSSSLAVEATGEVIPRPEEKMTGAPFTSSVAATSANIRGKQMESTSGVVPDGARGLLTEDPPSSSARNLVSNHKVQKLLETTINDNFCELVLYLNDVVPDFLDIFLSPACEEKGVEDEKSSPQRQQRLAQRPAASSFAAATLRSALEGRVVDLHMRFLQEWSTLTEVFEDVSDLVSKLHQESEVLQTTLDTHAAVAENFVGLMSTLQAELSLVRQREEEMREFQEKYNFTTEERRMLEENPVDSAYLDILQRAQVTYRKCRELLLSREHYQSAAAMMDITYTAIIKGSEKVARYLMSTLATTSGVASLCGDSSDMTGFSLRCVQFLREENLGQWAIVVEEVARLRRAVVLRQYFHLMTTGSATTSAGTYRAGVRNTGTHPNSGGTRPLEAEIGNPVGFFSSLFAWLHQVIVDEDDFLGFFFPPSPSQAVVGTTSTAAAAAPPESGVVTTDAERDAVLTPEETFDGSGGVVLPPSRASVLDSIFEVLCKHIQGILDGVLERFLRGASGPVEGGADGGDAAPPPSGPIGLTGGITRLLSAATGRATSLASDPTGNTRRYQHVINRSQQEALVATTLTGLTNGLHTAHTLLQLFTYYSCGTFTPLLGSDAALTRLVADDSKLQLLRVYHTIAKQLVERSLDSVASVVTRSAVLRSLASTEATKVVGEAKRKEAETATSFVAEYLFEHAPEEVKETGAASLYDDHSKLLPSPQREHQETLQSSSFEGSLSGTWNSSTSGNPYYRGGFSKHQAQPADLLRVLYSMVLPVPPEIVECLRVLQTTMVEAEKQVEIMESMKSNLLRASAHGNSVVINSSAYHEQFFTVLVQHVLSFSVVLARHSIVNSALDEPCKLVLQLNTMCALQETLAPHMGLLARGSAAAGNTAALSDVVLERIRELTKALVAALSPCAVRHYFFRRLHGNTTTTVANSDNRGNSAGLSALGVGKEVEFDAQQLDASTIVSQLSGFYGSVAASGRVYIPLVAALRSSKVQEEVVQGVLQVLCEVYQERHGRLLELQSKSLQGAEATGGVVPSSLVVDDLDPRKLRLLL